MLNNRTTRERYFLLAALAIAVLFAYYWVRYVPLQRAIAAATQQANKAKADIKKTKLPRVPVEMPAQLQRQIELLDAQSSTIGLKTKELQETYVFTAEENAMQSTLVEISTMANRTGVEIRESVPLKEPVKSAAPATESQSRRPRLNHIARTTKGEATANPVAAATPLPSTHVLAEIGEPHLQQLTLASDFAGLQALLSALETLPRRVVIVDVQAMSGSENEQLDYAPVVTTLVIAL